MHAYIHAFMHAYVQSYIHTYIHKYNIHAYMHTYMHTYIHTYIHTYTWLSTGTESNRSARFLLAMDFVSGCECSICSYAWSPKNTSQHFPIFKKVLRRSWGTERDPSSQRMSDFQLDYIRIYWMWHFQLCIGTEKYVSALSYFKKVLRRIWGNERGPSSQRMSDF